MLGVEKDQFRRALKAQIGRCGICRRKFKKGSVTAYADHDHKTGFFRGLLCRKCNTAIGGLHDSAALCYAAAKWLDDAEIHQKESQED